MLSATRVLVREANLAPAARFTVGCESAPISTRVVARGTRTVRQAVNKTTKKAMRGYMRGSANTEGEQLRLAYQNNAPEQPARQTLDTLTDVTPEYEHLRQFLPPVVLEEELAVVEARVRKAKTAMKKPSGGDSLWLMLAYLKAGELNQATVAWNDLLSVNTPDILHWNMMFAHLARSQSLALLSELYENFKLAVIKRRIAGPVPITYSILLKAFAERGDLEHVMEIYEDYFANRWIPEVYHLRCITKAAALAGDPRIFSRFMSRLLHKGVKISNASLKAHIDAWGRFQVPVETLKKSHITTGDYAATITYALRVRNYRRAYDLIHDCRDNLGIQPDARMYETVLRAMISDGYFRERARALKRRFHKYPKGIEVREEHFEFNALFDEVMEAIGKDANCAKIVDVGEQIRFARTTRKMSRKLYSDKIPERYDSGWEFDEFEWVPEYVQRKKELKLAQEQAAKADELQKIIQKAKDTPASL